MSGIQFQYPLAFWLLLSLPLLALIFVIYAFRRKKAMKKAGDVALIKAMMPEYSGRLKTFGFILILLAFALGCLALANPRKPDTDYPEARKGIDVVIALDVSNSMKATDINPSRLAAAKLFLSKMIDRLKDDRIGLVIFAGYAYAQMPLTFDHDAARMYVQSTDPSQIAAQGTNIGDAFEKSGIIFGNDEDRFRSVILVTDGETHDENSIDATKELAAKGVMINTIGIGSPQGAEILDSAGVPKKDAAGAVVISRLNEEILQNIASITRGKYIHLSNADEAVSGVVEQYSGIEGKALGDASLYNYETFYVWLILPMVLLLIGATFIPDRKKIKD